MASDTDFDTGTKGDPDPHRNLMKARADLIEAISGAGLPGRNDGQDPDLVKVGEGGLSFALVLNGEMIALDGNDANILDADAFEPFLERHKLAVEAGELDDQIARALRTPGPGKATARVRSIGPQVG